MICHVCFYLHLNISLHDLQIGITSYDLSIKNFVIVYKSLSRFDFGMLCEYLRFTCRHDCGKYWTRTRFI